MKGKSIKFVRMTIHEAKQILLFQLFHVYDTREASNIADWVMEYLTGWKKIDRIINKNLPMLDDQVKTLERFIEQFLKHRPVQYVLHEAWFMGMKLYVDENVLIPRPETEELVEWIITDNGNESSSLIILDIGTGSGCIPITIKKHLPNASVHACDISEEALKIAGKNAASHSTDIQFYYLDFLDRECWSLVPSCNILVSNPPYIPVENKSAMKENVLRYEPHIALFVENNDPLLYYRKLAEFGCEKLLRKGFVYVEIHEDLGSEVVRLFQEKGYQQVQVKKDMQGKDRMVKGRLI